MIRGAFKEALKPSFRTRAESARPIVMRYGVNIERLDVAAFTIPTDAPESDGTLRVGQHHDRGRRGAGRRRALARLQLRRRGHRRADRRQARGQVVLGRDALSPTARSGAMVHAIRNLGPAGHRLDGDLGGRHRAVGFEGASCSACRSRSLLGAGARRDADLRQRRLYVVLDPRVAGAARRLGRAGHSARQDEGRPRRGGRSGRVSRRARRRSAQTSSCSSTPTAATAASRRCDQPSASPKPA